MPACPQCSTDVAQGQRFCPNCGARQPDPPVQPGATVLLPPQSIPEPTTRLDPPPPAPGFGIPPATPPPAQAPTQATPAPPGSFSVPPSAPPGYSPPPANPQPVKGKTRWGLILGIIGGVLLLGCLGIAAAGYVFYTNVASTVTEQLTAVTIPEITPFAPVEVDAGAVLFSDDFESSFTSPFNTSSDEDSTFEIDNGVYVQTLNRANYFVWGFAGESFSDAVLEIDATIEGPTGGAAAIIFRYQDEFNFYIWRVYEDGSYTLDRYVDDELTELIPITDASAINPNGQTNRLRLETVGDSIMLYANGELIGSTSDSSFSDGDIALGVSAEDEAGVSITYDDLEVREAP